MYIIFYSYYFHLKKSEIFSGGFNNRIVKGSFLESQSLSAFVSSSLNFNTKLVATNLIFILHQFVTKQNLITKHFDMHYFNLQHFVFNLPNDQVIRFVTLRFCFSIFFHSWDYSFALIVNCLDLQHFVFLMM